MEEFQGMADGVIDSGGIFPRAINLLKKRGLAPVDGPHGNGKNTWLAPMRRKLRKHVMELFFQVFHAHLRVPETERNRIRHSPFILSGASAGHPFYLPHDAIDILRLMFQPRILFRTILLALLLALHPALRTGIAQAQTANDNSQASPQQFANLGICPLESGEKVQECRIGYRTWGVRNADSSNVILVPLWFTGNTSKLESSVGPGKVLDSSRYFIVGIDPLANGVSSSPSNSRVQPRMTFPAITIRDMVETEYTLATKALGLKHVHAVLGTSMGGMQTFEWMVAHPDFMDDAVPIVGSPRLTAYDLLLWHAEEDAIRSSPAWQMGNYKENPSIPMVQILHSMNITTPHHYAATTSREMFPAIYAGYGNWNADGFDANDRIYQLEAMIHQDVAHGGNLDAAAARVRAKVLAVVSEQDHMVNPGPAQEFAPKIHAKVLVLHSDCGHLAPNCEAQTVSTAVNAFLGGN